MAGRKIRSAEEARACLDAAEVSGLSRAAWARQNGVDGRSLNAWRLNLERRNRRLEPAPLRLLELVPTPSVGRAPIRILCDPFEVVVPTEFEDDELARVLRVLAAC